MRIILFLALFTAGSHISAQIKTPDLSYFLPKDVTYNDKIPTPKSVIGHEVGEWHVTHDKLVQYMKKLAAVSDRISIEDRGKTYEGRPLLLLTITSPKNHSSLESLKEQHKQLTMTGASKLNTAAMPVVVYQGFSIHGNEPSGSNAALAVAYYLAAAEGPKIDDLLENTVILFDPSLNPDGLQRFAYWANIHKSQNINPDPNDREYDEVWPGGRTNHYWFDVNRDWLPVQLPESRARLTTFHDWYPNLLTDHHEMGTNSSFFFQPGIPSRTHPLTPQKNQDLTKEIAKFHARAFDAIGSLYFSEENFDDFYYGKGSTYPDINGGVGILFEQASSRGHAQESDNGVLTFAFTIRNQFTAALSTLEAALNLREDLLNYQRDFYKQAREEGNNSGIIVFGDHKDRARSYHLAELLKIHNIDVYEVAADFSQNGKDFKKGFSYAVPMNQRQHRLIEAMFEKRTSFRDSLFYDISAWSLPLAFNLDYIENAGSARLGRKITDLKMPTPDTPNVSNYAYLMEWHEYYAPKALNLILKKGIRAKVSMKPFELEGKKYDYGTILIPVMNQDMNPADLTKFLAKVSRETKVQVNGVRTGLAKGIDLGSGQFRAVKPPSVALLVGEGVSSYDAGEIWHLFDTRYDMQITKLDSRTFSRTDLSRYTDIIIPSGWGSALGKAEAEKIKEWVKDGGTLVGYKNSGRWMDKHELMEIKLKTRKDSATNISFEERRKYRGAKVIGGAIFETVLDRSHPIAFGYRNKQLPVFRNSTLFVEPDKNSYNNPVKYTDSPLISGYISDDNLEQLANTVPFKVRRLGRGKVIYFTDNTNFRAFWYGTNKLLMNAIFFGDEM